MYLDEYKRWLAAELDDADLKPELAKIEGNDDEIKDRFAVALKFGTAGLRGVLGAGTNRMNIYVVRQATQGLANWVKTQGGSQTVAISYDSRLKSDVFAKTAAGVLAANGIKVRIYDALMPVPALSFATRYYQCNAGIIATDSKYGDQLNIRVLEKTKPTASIISPTQGSVLGSATQDIKMELQDAGGSGLNMTSVIFKVNSVQVTQGVSWTDQGGKKVCTYRAANLSDGSNSVSLQVTDNDGNISDVATVAFVISTSAPTLNVTSPTEGLLTNSNRVTVAGTAAAGSDAVTLTSVKINGEVVSFGSGGAFSKEITLREGENEITVVAEDSIGKTTSVTRHVTVDTKAPIISDVEAEATTVNANGMIRLSFKIVDPAD